MQKNVSIYDIRLNVLILNMWKVLDNKTTTNKQKT